MITPTESAAVSRRKARPGRKPGPTARKLKRAEEELAKLRAQLAGGGQAADGTRVPANNAPDAAPDAQGAPTDEKPAAAPVDPSDPFSGPVRALPGRPGAPAAPAGEEGPVGDGAAPGDAGARLGEDAARAYLPLLFGLVDTVACATASWALRRKLGPAEAAKVEEQAHQIAKLGDTERATLEAALVMRLAAIELTPDEMLLYAVLGIYGAKAMGVLALATQSAGDVITVKAS